MLIGALALPGVRPIPMPDARCPPARTMVAAWALFAAGMYMMRPNTLRADANQNGGNLEKPAPGDHGHDGAGGGPPPPPPTA